MPTINGVPVPRQLTPQQVSVMFPGGLFGLQNSATGEPVFPGGDGVVVLDTQGDYVLPLSSQHQSGGASGGYPSASHSPEPYNGQHNLRQAAVPRRSKNEARAARGVGGDHEGTIQTPENDHEEDEEGQHHEYAAEEDGDVPYVLRVAKGMIAEKKRLYKQRLEERRTGSVERGSVLDQYRAATGTRHGANGGGRGSPSPGRAEHKKPWSKDTKVKHVDPPLIVDPHNKAFPFQQSTVLDMTRLRRYRISHATDQLARRTKQIQKERIQQEEAEERTMRRQLRLIEQMKKHPHMEYIRGRSHSVTTYSNRPSRSNSRRGSITGSATPRRGITPDGFSGSGKWDFSDGGHSGGRVTSRSPSKRVGSSKISHKDPTRYLSLRYGVEDGLGRVILKETQHARNVRSHSSQRGPTRTGMDLYTKPPPQPRYRQSELDDGLRSRLAAFVRNEQTMSPTHTGLWRTLPRDINVVRYNVP